MSSPLIQLVLGAADASGPVSTPFKRPSHERSDTPPFATILDDNARERARGTEGSGNAPPPARNASPRERNEAPATSSPPRPESNTRSDGSARENVRTSAPEGSHRENGSREADRAAASENATDAGVAESNDGKASAPESDQDGPIALQASPAIVAAIVSMLAGRHDAEDVPADTGQQPADAWPHANTGSSSKNRNFTLEALTARLGDDSGVALPTGKHAPVGSAPTAAVSSAASAQSSPAATRLPEALTGHAAAGASMQSPLAGTANAVPGALTVAGVAQRLESGTLQLPVHTPASQRLWAEDVGSRLIWMAGRGESKAELVLTPPSLGKLAVSIQVNGDQASAQFVAATPVARDALEQALPRLREVLQQAGISLGEANVSTSGEQQARGDANGQQEGHHRSGQRATAAPVVQPIAQPAAVWSSGGLGMIDTFA